jgi:hypothetical protein
MKVRICFNCEILGVGHDETEVTVSPSVFVRRNTHSIDVEKTMNYLQVLGCWFSCYLWEAGVRE